MFPNSEPYFLRKLRHLLENNNIHVHPDAGSWYILAPDGSLWECTVPELEKDSTKEVLNWSVELLCLSKYRVRIGNCLSNAGVATVGALVNMTEGDLLRLPNFGRKCLRTLKTALSKVHLSLRKDQKHHFHKQRLVEVDDGYARDGEGRLKDTTFYG